MKKIFATIILVFISLSLPQSAPAEILMDKVIDNYTTVERTTLGEGNFTRDPEKIVVNIIKQALSFLGLVFIIIIIWSGYQWMTAGGNAETVTTAKKRILNAVIGLIIVLAAYIIADFIISRAAEVTTGTKIGE